MKKRTLLVIGVSMLALAGCGADNEAVKNVEPKQNVSVVEETTDNKNNPEVTIDQLPYEMEILPPDSIGEIYGKMTFTNNSKYPVKYFEVSINMLDKNEKSYFISPDTVMPGETSPNFEAFSSADSVNNELLTITYTYVDDNDQEVYVEYNAKLDKYNY